MSLGSLALNKFSDWTIVMKGAFIALQRPICLGQLGANFCRGARYPLKFHVGTFSPPTYYPCVNTCDRMLDGRGGRRDLPS